MLKHRRFLRVADDGFPQPIAFGLLGQKQLFDAEPFLSLNERCQPRDLVGQSCDSTLVIDGGGFLALDAGVDRFGAFALRLFLFGEIALQTVGVVPQLCCMLALGRFGTGARRRYSELRGANGRV